MNEHQKEILNAAKKLLAMDNRWITVKPNGEESKGSPVQIDDSGRVLKGMGGKFKGEKINEIRKDFVGAKTPKPDKQKEQSRKELKNKAEADKRESAAAGRESKVTTEPKENTGNNKVKTNIGHIARETEKAVMVNAYCEVGGHDKPIKVGVWFPKSRLDENGNAPPELIRMREKELQERFRGGMYSFEFDGGGYYVGGMAAGHVEPYKGKEKKGTYLNVPYAQKDIAKQHGAKWDSEKKKWYLPEGVEMSDALKGFAKDSALIILAQDRSARSYDKDGRLHVAVSNISKAAINPYYGSEIPNFERLGLDAKKVYFLLRDPEELEKAASTFNNLPLLNKHIPVSADNPRKDIVVGSTGSDVSFSDGYLKCSLSVWDSEAISGIESGEQMELSSAYHYTPDMTAGEYEGRKYDGVMRDIVGNHVALVDVGRAGRDVVVSDADPFHERKAMKLKQGAEERIRAVLRPIMAQDAELSPDEILEVVGALTNEVQTAEDDGEEMPPEEVGADDEEVAEYEAEESEDDKTAEDEADPGAPEAPEDGAPKPAQDNAVTKVSMDAAIKAAVAAERKRAHALATAQREVAPYVGEVAMDSAEDVYKFALEQNGVDVSGVHPSAYRAMVGMFGKSKSMAMDSAGGNSAAKQFKGLGRIRKG